MKFYIEIDPNPAVSETKLRFDGRVKMACRPFPPKTGIPDSVTVSIIESTQPLDYS
jgi:hypothetical protein